MYYKNTLLPFSGIRLKREGGPYPIKINLQAVPLL